MIAQAQVAQAQVAQAQAGNSMAVAVHWAQAPPTAHSAQDINGWLAHVDGADIP